MGFVFRNRKEFHIDPRESYLTLKEYHTMVWLTLVNHSIIYCTFVYSHHGMNVNGNVQKCVTAVERVFFSINEHNFISRFVR